MCADRMVLNKADLVDEARAAMVEHTLQVQAVGMGVWVPCVAYWINHACEGVGVVGVMVLVLVLLLSVTGTATGAVEDFPGKNVHGGHSVALAAAQGSAVEDVAGPARNCGCPARGWSLAQSQECHLGAQASVLDGRWQAKERRAVTDGSVSMGWAALQHNSKARDAISSLNASTYTIGERV